MNKSAKSSFRISQWNEKTYQEIEGSAKLCHAKAIQSYTGTIVGKCRADYPMSYTACGTGTLEARHGEAAEVSSAIRSTRLERKTPAQSASIADRRAMSGTDRRSSP